MSADSGHATQAVHNPAAALFSSSNEELRSAADMVIDALPWGPPTPQGLCQWFTDAVEQLKLHVLALYYALEDPRTGMLPRTLGFLALMYVLSPMDLIPDLIPILGLVDDLLLVPGLIWLAVKLIPAEVWAEAQQRAELEPPRLGCSWGAACLVFMMWDALLLWLVYLGCKNYGSHKVRHLRLWVVGGCAAVLLVGEAAWVWCKVASERLQGRAAAAAGKGGAANDLEEALLQGGDQEQQSREPEAE